MYAYRRHRFKKKKLNPAVILCVMGAAGLILLLGGDKSLLRTLGEEGKKICYEKLLELYMPGVVSSAKSREELSFAERLLYDLFPETDGEETTETYQTQIESELSYETILAREAADENYVDEETGELVEAGAPSEEIGSTSPTEPNTDTAQQEGEAEEVQQAAVIGSGEKVVTYAREKLNDFDYLMQNFYQVDNTTTISSSQLNADALLGKDLRLSHDASTPQILIYHTHSQEGYADSVEGDASTTVVGVGDYLTKLLTEQYGFSVIHHKGEYDVGDRDHAYSKAGPALEQLLAENPSIEVVIDLHRDGVREDTRLVTTMNGTQMAQIMFFNGLSRTTSTGDIDYLYNPNLADNLAFSFQMQLKAAEYYPGFTRRIYLKGYRYNMHYCPKTLLIEVGAQTNTVQEAMNAMVPLADVLNKVLTGQQ